MVPILLPLQELRLHWAKKLTLSEKNPYPLAPSDLVKMGLVTAENYLAQNLLFGQFCTSTMERELLQLSAEPGFANAHKEVQVIGAGLARDLYWLQKAAELGMTLTVRDVSGVACANARMLGERLGIDSQMECLEGEFENGWAQSEETPLVTYASQFIQVQSIRKMRRIMKCFGSLLRTPEDEPRRRLYLVHPLPEDNDTPRSWNNIQLPAPKWGDSLLYKAEDCLKYARCGLNGNVELDILGKHDYFHQKYSFLRLMPGK
ncbi:MAG: hypothetical protein PHV93_04300 [Candidatus Pacebacteria bacterium]|nr:hypothetical protein [Candidatus Paceibacterota bacterium]